MLVYFIFIVGYVHTSFIERLQGLQFVQLRLWMFDYFCKDNVPNLVCALYHYYSIKLDSVQKGAG